MDAFWPAQLDRIRARLARLVARTASRLVDSEGRVSDRFVARTELVETIEHSQGRDVDVRGAIDAADTRVHAADARAHEAGLHALSAGLNPPLLELYAAFSLDDAEQLLLLATLAAELEPAIGRAYTHAWADFTKKLPDVGFLVELLADQRISASLFRAALHPASTLARDGIVVLSPPTREDEPRSLWRVRASGRVADYASGLRELPAAQWGRAARLVAPTVARDALLHSVEEVERFWRAMDEAPPVRLGGAPVALVGPDGAGRRELVEAWAGERGLRVMAVWLDQIPSADEAFSRLLLAARREASLWGAPLFFTGRGSQAGPLGLSSSQAAALVACIDASRTTVVVAMETMESWLTEHFPGVLHTSIAFPSAEAQAELWSRHLPVDVPLAFGVDMRQIVARYALPGGAIRRAAQDLRAQMLVLSPSERRLTGDRIYRAVRRQLTHRLGDLAEVVSLAYTWDDLILPEDSQNQLKQLVSYYRNRHKVLTEWGFGGTLIYGRGLTALLSGPPGTGKTMSAAVVARELGMELYRVDLSRIVDKYIGETEKNLSKVFDEAERAQAVLLFDEADSLFGKRTEVRNSVDRYANIEVNYLLQRMENYDGVTILTTNIESGIDEAFKRRIRYRITFPFPEAPERERLWRSMIPKEAKMSGDMDFALLAEDFEMSGGHIKNAIIRSAIFAAEEGDEITFEHLLRGASHEYQEMGKLVRTYGD